MPHRKSDDKARPPGVPAVVFEPVTQAEYDRAEAERERVFRDFQLAARQSNEEKALALGRKQERYAVAQIERLAAESAYALAEGRPLDRIERDLEYFSRQLAEGLIKQGRFRDAAEVSDDLYDEALALDDAARRPDGARCECPDDPATGLPSEVAGGRRFSERHAGFVYEVRCACCDFRNLTPVLPSDVERLVALRADPSLAKAGAGADSAVLKRGGRR